MGLRSENGSNDLLGRKAADGDPLAPDGASLARSGRNTTGILPFQELEVLAKTTREIVGLEPIQDDQFQPASLDLRLGPTAYRVRASFLPGPHATVQDKLDALAMHRMDISNGGVLERGDRGNFRSRERTDSSARALRILPRGQDAMGTVKCRNSVERI